MKKIFSTIIVILLLVFMFGCSQSGKQGAVLPPTRIGTDGVFYASLVEEYTFESAFSCADAVARIRVGNWIGEDTEIHQTYYNATVLECFKGNIPQTFTLLQDGCSTFTMQRYPLFTNGNEMLVFLKTVEGLNYEAPYWIIGAFTTVMDVSYDESGNRYFADRYGIIGTTVEACVNHSLDKPLAAEVLANAAEADTIVKTMDYKYPYIYSEAELKELMEGL